MIKTTTFWATLMGYAKAEAEARKSGDPERLRIAEQEHESYRQSVLNSDEMVLDTVGGLLQKKHLE